ncbi:unnamed protein product [Cyprideis torosa]|uniref:ATP-binding cassette sub-family F member 3 n=1 Tax=Cyprideis torosa TaxID=163714 RepID=A0A7R8W5G5_9CRUS|nr:unnamed protein product [Cyprideis torosa]CAG0880865.1 unnamed protein product [Cyprideis torosa]
MPSVAEVLQTSLPGCDLDSDILNYVESILDDGACDFHSSEDVYDAVGPVLLDIGEGTGEDEIRDICDRLYSIIFPEETGKHSSATVNGIEHKPLEAPVHLNSLVKDAEVEEEIESIWLRKREDVSRVDQTKLAKAEAKAQQKASDRKDGMSTGPRAIINAVATASQQISKKDVRMEARGTNKCKDIQIDNFDVAFGDRVLISGASLSLGYGRRYGLVGRNGLGKTTLLRMIAGAHLMIPSHISVLHVEQEVTGDDTLAINSVLEADSRRESLLAEEKSINAKIAQGDQSEALSSRLTEIYAELEAMEADKAPARASSILAGLGFSTQMQSMPTKEFSGGWRMRLALARALFSLPDLLLLDEPTNMLDMKAIIWLEKYLQGWPSTILVVSHDRKFLEEVPTDMLHLHTQRIDVYKGNYSSFISTREARLKNQQREYEAQQQLRAHVQEFIDKFRYNAKRASLVQSKIKMLEKLPVLQPVEEETNIVLKFPDCEYLSPPILHLDDVGFYYTKTKPIFSKIDVSGTMESRICIVGENGAGKTTLLKLVLGMLTPTSGSRNVHRNLKFGYFTQHHVDQLDMTLCSIEILQKHIPGRENLLRNTEEYLVDLVCLEIFQHSRYVASLSGGQKSRLAFAVLACTKPNFLILDEPTNHLDIETIEALGNAINKFKVYRFETENMYGGVILVSHDERLIQMVCKELWVVSEGQVTRVEGGFDEYRRCVEKEIEKQNQDTSSANGTKTK